MNMRNLFKNINISKWVFWFVFASLLISMIYAIIHIILPVNSEIIFFRQLNRDKSDYVLVVLQCVLGLICIFLPSVIERRLKYNFSNNLILVYVIFLYCAIYLGEVHNFYVTVRNWDTILHAFSGMMLGVLGFTLVDLLNSSDKVRMQLSPLFVAIFAFSFAVSLGVIWEIYEFFTDGVFNVNMQRHISADGIPLVGREALLDTMKDLIVDCLGALGIALIGYVFLRRGHSWFSLFRRKGNGQIEEEAG